LSLQGKGEGSDAVQLAKVGVPLQQLPAADKPTLVRKKNPFTDLLPRTSGSDTARVADHAAPKAKMATGKSLSGRIRFGMGRAANT
jgi:hypothetical protein